MKDHKKAETMKGEMTETTLIEGMTTEIIIIVSDKTIEVKEEITIMILETDITMIETDITMIKIASSIIIEVIIEVTEIAKIKGEIIDSNKLRPT